MERNWERGNHNKTILYENIYIYIFSIREKKAKNVADFRVLFWTPIGNSALEVACYQYS